MTPSIFYISILFVVISMVVSMILKGKFARYSKILLSRGLTGREVAEKMLRENNIFDVKVVSVNGFLSDHYNPQTKIVNLRAEVYEGSSIAAAAVAAHECGHAIQHADAYQWLKLRSGLVPVVQFSSSLVQWVLLAGILLINTFPQLLLAGIILFGVTTLFSVITLPVEFDASRRALAWLRTTNVVTNEEYPKAKDSLQWAALTYVVAALASIATLVQYIFLYQSRSRD